VHPCIWNLGHVTKVTKHLGKSPGNRQEKLRILTFTSQHWSFTTSPFKTTYLGRYRNEEDQVSRTWILQQRMLREEVVIHSGNNNQQVRIPINKSALQHNRLGILSPHKNSRQTIRTRLKGSLLVPAVRLNHFPFQSNNLTQENQTKHTSMRISS